MPKTKDQKRQEAALRQGKPGVEILNPSRGLPPPGPGKEQDFGVLSGPQVEVIKELLYGRSSVQAKVYRECADWYLHRDQNRRIIVTARGFNYHAMFDLIQRAITV
jgi:hypothetical protein